MADLVVVVGVLAFFAISALFVAGCDRIIGPDEPDAAGTSADGARDEIGAPGAAR